MTFSCIGPFIHWNQETPTQTLPSLEIQSPSLAFGQLEVNHYVKAKTLFRYTKNIKPLFHLEQNACRKQPTSACAS